MSTRSSLRTEFLFSLAFLAGAALLLALWAARALQRAGVGTLVLAGFVAVAVLVFALLANHLVERWVLKPLAEIGRSAEAIAAGEFERRVEEAGPLEIASVARALNQLTDQLLNNQARLAENVRSLDETNQRLTEAQRDLVQAEKLASLGQLAAGVAHEIGNPLGAILGYTSLHKRRGGDAEIAEGLEREARRIDRIVRGLLEYARPASTTREEVDLNSSIERVVHLLREQGRLSEVEIRLDLADGLPAVVGDPHRIDQIFVNLLQNAEAAMEGKGRVTIQTRGERYEPERARSIRRADDPPGVDYSHLRRRRYDSLASAELGPNREVVRVSVTDSGPGMPEDHLGSIFDPFFTTKGPGAGIGLGLAIVAGTVADIGGKIEASTAAEGGATFTLWLPTALRA